MDIEIQLECWKHNQSREKWTHGGVRPPFCPKAKQPINLLHSNFIHICILMLLHISVLMHYIQNPCKSLTKIILNKLEDWESVPKRNTLILKALILQ